MQEIAVYLNSKAGKGGDASVWEREILRCLFRSNVTFRKPDTLSELEENLEFDINRKVDSIICWRRWYGQYAYSKISF